MHQVSPILKSMINKAESGAAVNTAQPKSNLTQEPDTVELSKKPDISKKKIAKYAAIAFCTAAAIGGAILLIKKGKMPAEVKAMHKGAQEAFTEATKMQQRATEFAAEATKLADETKSKAEKMAQEVIELFNNGGKKDGVQVAEIIEENSIFRMIEKAQDGVIARESEFDSSKALRKIIERLQDGKQNKYYFIDDLNMRCELGIDLSNSEYTKIANRIDLFPDGDFRIDNGIVDSKLETKIPKSILIMDGNVEEYSEGITETNSKTMTNKEIKHCYWSKFKYIENTECNKDGTKTAKALTLRDGKVDGYRLGIQNFNPSEELIYDSNGIPVEYLKNTIDSNGKIVSLDKHLIFENGKWVKVPCEASKVKPESKETPVEEVGPTDTKDKPIETNPEPKDVEPSNNPSNPFDDTDDFYEPPVDDPRIPD